MSVFNPTAENRCYRHSDRLAGVGCQRCSRPICPECMHAASVGYWCPDCMRSARGTSIPVRQLLAEQRPIVTYALIAINVLVYVIDVATARSGAADLLSDYATLRGIDGVRGVANGEWWLLITGGFLHASLFHIGFNMFALYSIGGLLERRIGSLQFALVYFGGLLSGSVGVMLGDPFVSTVGASGAIMGLAGALMIRMRAGGIDIRSSGLLPMIAINLALPALMPNVISFPGHFGGLIGGLVVGAAVTGFDHKSHALVLKNRMASLAVAASLVVVLFLLGVLLGMR